ncbi:MAG: hypothetical protein ABI551_11810 [Polyangiaceae bacterium]
MRASCNNRVASDARVPDYDAKLKIDALARFADPSRGTSFNASLTRRWLAACVVMLALGSAGCRKSEHSSAESSSQASTAMATAASSAAPATSCANDADCRLVACAGCSCSGVHNGDPDGCPAAVCAVWPCAGMVPTCDTTMHLCRAARAPHDAGVR